MKESDMKYRMDQSFRDGVGLEIKVALSYNEQYSCIRIGRKRVILDKWETEKLISHLQEIVKQQLPK